MQYEIYWNDLNKDAKERMKNIYHKNIDMSPLTIIEVIE